MINIILTISIILGVLTCIGSLFLLIIHGLTMTTRNFMILGLLLIIIPIINITQNGDDL